MTPVAFLCGLVLLGLGVEGRERREAKIMNRIVLDKCCPDDHVLNQGTVTYDVYTKAKNKLSFADLHFFSTCIYFSDEGMGYKEDKILADDHL